MKLAFYRAKFGDWRDLVISWWTIGPYSHCELLFSDGQWFSSSPRDNGTRFKSINLVPERWDLVEIQGDYEEQVKAWCEDRVGLPYDWWGIFSCGFGLRTNAESKWYCSEICVMALREHGVLQINPWVSPNKLYKQLTG